MPADYDNKGDAIQIELDVSVDRLDRDDASISGAIVGIRDEKPVMVDFGRHSSRGRWAAAPRRGAL
jgi:hypothetical protein